jgi:hypothetical protein
MGERYAIAARRRTLSAGGVDTLAEFILALQAFEVAGVLSLRRANALNR